MTCAQSGSKSRLQSLLVSPLAVADAGLDELAPHFVPPAAGRRPAAELAIGNIVRRVLHIIREEAQQEEIEELQAATPVDKVDISKQQVGMPAHPQHSPLSSHAQL